MIAVSCNRKIPEAWVIILIYFNQINMATKWKIDPTHSEIQFKVKHLMITTVTGYFERFDAEFETEDDDIHTARNLRFSADINSINTNNEQRDTHLKSADFFNAEEHGELTFVSTGRETDGDHAKVHGDLTIRGVTKPVTIEADYAGTVVDPYGQTKAGFTITGKISRKEFGLVWNAVTEAGAVVVSDDIRLNAEVQFIKQG
jgi:polyisoprenoid-binding protein YceI